MNDGTKAHTGRTHRGAKILLIDDSPDHCSLIQTVLQESIPDAHLLIASTQEQAITQLKSCEEAKESLPRLILLDLYFPLRDDGWQVLQLLKESTSPYRLIPVTVLSYSSQPEDIQTSYDLGATSYIVKPGTFQQWIAYFQALRQYWWQTVSLPI